MGAVNLTYLLSDALATEWMMTLEGCQALRQIYFDALDQKKHGSLRASDIEALWARHEAEGLGEAMHMLRQEDGRMALATKPMEGSNYTSTFKNIAIIDIIGPIVPRVRGMSSGSVGAQQIKNDFVKAFESGDIKAILLNVDSPGGDARGISELAQTIQRARNKGTKWIYAYAAGWMASAAYFISAASHRIIANDWASVGSIGVVIGVPPPMPDDNIEFVSTSSPYKRPDIATGEGKKIYQDKADYLGMLFIEAVADLRGVSVEKVVSDFGKGSTLVGKQAKTAGLVDAIGTFDSALHALMTSRTLPAPVSQPPANAQGINKESEAMVKAFGAGGLLLYQKAIDAGLVADTDLSAELLDRDTKNLNSRAMLQDGDDRSLKGVDSMADKTTADEKEKKPAAADPPAKEQPPKTEAKVEDKTADLAAAQAENERLKAELAEAKASNENQGKELSQVKASVEELQKQARTSRFTQLSSGWPGETKSNLAMLEHLATTSGEDSDLFKAHVQSMNAAKAQIDAGVLFKEKGSNAPVEGSALAEIEAKAKTIVDASGGKITREQAISDVTAANPDLYKQYLAEQRSGAVAA